MMNFTGLPMAGTAARADHALAEASQARAQQQGYQLKEAELLYNKRQAVLQNLAELRSQAQERLLKKATERKGSLFGPIGAIVGAVLAPVTGGASLALVAAGAAAGGAVGNAVDSAVGRGGGGGGGGGFDYSSIPQAFSNLNLQMPNIQNPYYGGSYQGQMGYQTSPPGYGQGGPSYTGDYYQGAQSPFVGPPQY